MENETLVFSGGEIKALGDGKVAGYLVRFGNPKDTDLEGDFFDKSTEFGIEDNATMPVFYQHGYDSNMKMRKVGKGILKYDDAGLWLEAQLELRDEYEKMIYQLAEDGKLGYSSGAAGHLVERETVGKSHYIKTWIIAEASLTPTPAEPRNTVMPVKSLFETEPEQATDVAESEEIQTQEKPEMNEEELKSLLESVAATAADNAVKKMAEQKPDVKGGYSGVEVTGDEADRALGGNPFKPTEFFKAVKDAALAPHAIDKRLLPLKATGLNEAIPSQGGFLLPQEVAAGILQRTWGTGTVLSQFKPITVTGNSLTLNAVDETSRADGSRMGGVVGYWLAEGGTKTASKPKFDQIELKLKKVAALCYATDELLDDVTAMESWINNYVPDELRFMVEDALINGDGVGKPLGILSSGALVSATRTDASEIDALDIGRMWSSRYPGVNDYVWFVNSNIFTQLINMSVGNMPVYMPPGGLSGAPYGTILGRPVIETEYNPGLGTAGDILLAAPSQYAMITKGGIQAASSIHVQFVTDETAFRFVYRCDGQPGWKSAVTRYKPSSGTVSPFVVLSATT